MTCPHAELLEEVKKYYPGLNVIAHLEELVEKGKKRKELLNSTDTPIHKLCKLLKGNKFILELRYGKGFKLEVVDDDVDVDALSTILKDEGCDVTVTKRDGVYFIDASGNTSIAEDILELTHMAGGVHQDISDLYSSE